MTRFDCNFRLANSRETVRTCRKRPYGCILCLSILSSSWECALLLRLKSLEVCPIQCRKVKRSEQQQPKTEQIFHKTTSRHIMSHDLFRSKLHAYKYQLECLQCHKTKSDMTTMPLNWAKKSLIAS